MSLNTVGAQSEWLTSGSLPLTDALLCPLMPLPALSNTPHSSWPLDCAAGTLMAPRCGASAVDPRAALAPSTPPYIPTPSTHLRATLQP